jgi:hypothetical protein
MPSRTAAASSPSAPPSGAQSVRIPPSVAMPPIAEEKWLIGSETPKNISPMPMPAAKSIENQPA